MNELWKGIAIAGIWLSVAVIAVVAILNDVEMEGAGLIIGATLATIAVTMA